MWSIIWVAAFKSFFFFFLLKNFFSTQTPCNQNWITSSSNISWLSCFHKTYPVLFQSSVSGTTGSVNLPTDEHKKGKGTQDIKTAKSWWIQKIYRVSDSFSLYEESCWSKEAESKEEEVWTTLADSRFPLTLWTTIPQRVIEHLVAQFRCFLVFANTGLTLQTPSAAVCFFFLYLPIARMHLACR